MLYSSRFVASQLGCLGIPLMIPRIVGDLSGQSRRQDDEFVFSVAAVGVVQCLRPDTWAADPKLVMANQLVRFLLSTRRHFCFGQVAM